MPRKVHSIDSDLLKYKVQIHIIFGPTAASKTKIAQGLWDQYHYPILSVDSRKVYKGANIGTNKLSMLKFRESYPGALVGGIDFLDPTRGVNAYIYQQYVYKWIDDHKSEIDVAGGLIIHGGTGLYLDAIVEGRSFLSSRNSTLRTELEALSVEQLQQRAKEADIAAFKKMNHSDKQNPRRLVRVIENAGIPEVRDQRAEFFSSAEIVWHITIPDRKTLYETINNRVLTYFSQGWLEEVASLLKQYGPDAAALKMMGYHQLVKFISQNKNWQQLVDDDMPQFQVVVSEIQQDHRRYAKRQETWAKKYLRATQKLVS